MQRIQAEFIDGEVDTLAILASGPSTGIPDYISDTGLRSPVAMDLVEFAGGTCWEVPEADGSLYEHYRQRMGQPYLDPPFPVQVIIDGQGRIAYLSRDYRPDEILETLQDLVRDSR
ncbi:MAG: hypothetical protein VX498_14460 [Myxococcota bacterium]|nr:hypothetical protein [Myxococcota bacterium]